MWMTLTQSWLRGWPYISPTATPSPTERGSICQTLLRLEKSVKPIFPTLSHPNSIHSLWPWSCFNDAIWGLCHASSASQSFAIIADSENITVFSIDWRRSKTDGHKFWRTSLCQVGGLQLKDAQPLEGKLKEFMDSATGDATLLFVVMLIFSNAR